MMTNIVFGVCCYISEKEQIPELERLLESLRGFKVFLIDGKWKDFDDKTDNYISIPEAYEAIGKYSNVITMASYNGLEWQNRNLYLKCCKRSDILIWIDTDEWLEIQDKDQMLKECKKIKKPMFLVNFYDKRFGGECLQRRGYRYPKGTHHKDRHNQAYYKKEEIFAYPAKAPKGFVIHQDKSFRSVERELDMKVRNQKEPFR